MSGVLQGFLVIGVMIAAGYLTKLFGLVRGDIEEGLSRLVFFVMTPSTSSPSRVSGASSAR
ncbi:hypothetical protein [Aestuariimicrobium ganziense]|uniref:hypothetical protein n=1 Tax=Aestuariimicrobium ganziense TaxID=2773677 RepID=UPI00194477E3|nr:hypothetical protein [Aestuariimicrobium ganziense]